MDFKLIAYYLPQYHPIPENDQWWGRGFTEWTNVAKAKALYRGHYQPRIPSDFGYYDLRVPEVREEQASLARSFGIHGFCYYHYWFGNKKLLLERPLKEIIASGKPDFPFMLCWANQTWKGVWFGTSNGKTLIEQLYPGKGDYIDHFNYLITPFRDSRYIKIDGKPVFHVYMPLDIPDLPLFVNTFRDCAAQAGLPGIYLLATNCPEDWNPLYHGFDGIIPNEFQKVRYYASRRLVKNRQSFAGKVETKIRDVFGDRKISDRKKPYILPYRKAIALISTWKKKPFDNYPLVLPDWDNSARAGNKSLIFHGSTPVLWKDHLSSALKYAENLPEERRMVFIKSWNEWAEGNYLEPDQKWGTAYLKVVHELLQERNGQKI